MRAYTHEVVIPRREIDVHGLEGLKHYYDTIIKGQLPAMHQVIRFVITSSDRENYHCEMEVLEAENEKDFALLRMDKTIFDHRKRGAESTKEFVAALLIPTGVGAEIGGHCGDGNTTAKLIASACDKLIVHPNVVNASDLNEMTPNTLYAEGSIVTRLFMGQIGLRESRINKMLMIMEKHPDPYFNNEVVNAVSAARITVGIDCDVLEIGNVFESVSTYSPSGRAAGEIENIDKLFEVVKQFKDRYDAIGLSTYIKVPPGTHTQYFDPDDKMVNPWGGIEAILTHSIAENFEIPCAHSPMLTQEDVDGLSEEGFGIVEPRKAPETSSTTFLHCILKGLHKSPGIAGPNEGVRLEDISCLIIPDGCVGLPVLSCVENNIPVIAVRENKNNMRNDLSLMPFRSNKLFIVESYLEAVGIMHCLKAGVAPESVRRPLKYTTKF